MFAAVWNVDMTHPTIVMWNYQWYWLWCSCCCCYLNLQNVIAIVYILCLSIENWHNNSWIKFMTEYCCIHLILSPLIFVRPFKWITPYHYAIPKENKWSTQIMIHLVTWKWEHFEFWARCMTFNTGCVSWAHEKFIILVESKITRVTVENGCKPRITTASSASSSSSLLTNATATKTKLFQGKHMQLVLYFSWMPLHTHLLIQLLILSQTKYQFQLPSFEKLAHTLQCAAAQQF